MYAEKGLGIGGGESRGVLLQALVERDESLGTHMTAWRGTRLRSPRSSGSSAARRSSFARRRSCTTSASSPCPRRSCRSPGGSTTRNGEIVQQHTLIGERIIAAAEGLEHVALTVRSTHERWDGTGYPDGLRGEEIPLAARMIAICDAYDAITSERPYRHASTQRTGDRRAARVGRAAVRSRARRGIHLPGSPGSEGARCDRPAPAGRRGHEPLDVQKLLRSLPRSRGTGRKMSAARGRGWLPHSPQPRAASRVSSFSRPAGIPRPVRSCKTPRKLRRFTAEPPAVEHAVVRCSAEAAGGHRRHVTCSTLQPARLQGADDGPVLCTARAAAARSAWPCARGSTCGRWPASPWPSDARTTVRRAEMVRLEIRGRVVAVSRAQVECAQRLAHGQAGASSSRRDLALVLDWALNSSHVVSLRRGEARELERLALEQSQLAELAAALSAPRRAARAA